MNETVNNIFVPLKDVSIGKVIDIAEKLHFGFEDGEKDTLEFFLPCYGHETDLKIGVLYVSNDLKNVCDVIEVYNYYNLKGYSKRQTDKLIEKIELYKK